MERVGYDEQTSTYTFLDHTDGTYWEGEEGSRYGVLHRQGHSRPQHSASYIPTMREDYAHFLPFALIICAVLGALFWYVGGRRGVRLVHCGEGWDKYVPVTGDTCWSIAEERGTDVKGLLERNLGLVCEELRVGWPICVPDVKKI